MGTRRRRAVARGALSVEFAVVMTASLSLFAPAGEFFRLSLMDQTLARATHLAARAAGADPADCMAAVTRAFMSDAAARWLLDFDNDGAVAVVAAGGSGEVEVTVEWDADPADAVPWTGAGCGGAGDWIRVRARIVVQPWFGPLRALWQGGVTREHESWGRNQT